MTREPPLPRNVYREVVRRKSHVPQPRARRSDPATSQAAAQRAKTIQGKHHATILAVLRAAGVPLTAHDISAASNGSNLEVERDAEGLPCRLLIGPRPFQCAMTFHQVSRRMHELEAAALVRVVGRNGRFQTYALTESNPKGGT